ncbi:MAG: LysR family transcriptional regulator, partial [Pseudomonadota bacterium]
MPLTLDALAMLDAIDRRGSFARAAEDLGRAPSSLTYAVQQIEAELDVLL